MKKTNWIILLVVIVIAILGLLTWRYQKDKFVAVEEDNVRNKTLLTPADKIIPPPPGSKKTDSRLRIYNLTASKDGFSVPRIVVNKDDNIQFNITALDGKYDFGVKNYGFYMLASNGITVSGGFSAVHLGTFEYSCETFCPPTGKITGELVVLE